MSSSLIILSLPEPDSEFIDLWSMPSMPMCHTITVFYSRLGVRGPPRERGGPRVRSAQDCSGNSWSMVSIS